jgi:hypothetical protein
MGKYGEAAVRAVLLLNSGKAACPDEAWETATSELFGKGTFSQSKGCPRLAFLGLCEAGLVKGVNSSQRMKNSKNKKYAIEAVALLWQDPELASNK